MSGRESIGGGRTAERLTCWLCEMPAVWLVTETRSFSGEELMTCEKHKLTAFS